VQLLGSRTTVRLSINGGEFFTLDCLGMEGANNCINSIACAIGLANGMNIGVPRKILGDASIQVRLDSYATVIDSLMLQNVHDLKNKLSSS